MEIRRSYDRLISTMGFPILVRWHLYIESGPWSVIPEHASANDMAPILATSHKQAQYGLHRQMYIKHTLSTYSLWVWCWTVSNVIRSCQSVFLFIVYSSWNTLYWYRLHGMRFCVYVFYQSFIVYILCLLFNSVYLWTFMPWYLSEMTKIKIINQ